ncbi:MAG: thioester reductase domain-containing protein [Planctomycetota bacterium]
MSDQSQSLSELLNELRSLGVRLRVEGDGLRCDAPVGVIDKVLGNRIREHKRQIISLLRSRPNAESSIDDDLKLRESIRPACNSGERRSNAIFLTGATGFLGRYLLSELLRQTDAVVYCLVRNQEGAPTGETRSTRLRSASIDAGADPSQFDSRVIEVPGDLSRPNLGIASKTQEELVREVVCVLHNGATVHHGMPYRSLKRANVDGTEESIELACRADASFHYVSTISVFPPTPPSGRSMFYESDSLDEFPAPQGGYNLSKWVGEHLVTEASARGLPAAIYRPGPISGDSRTGQFNGQDFLCRLMQGYIQSGIAPVGEMTLDLLPVDYVAQVIVYLAKQFDLPGTRAQSLRRFHLLHPQPAPSDMLFDACGRAGFSIDRVPYDQWFKHLMNVAATADETHPLYPLASLFSSRRTTTNDVPAETIPFDMSCTRDALEAAQFSPPALDADLFDRYLAKLTESGLLDSSRSSRESRMVEHPSAMLAESRSGGP